MWVQESKGGTPASQLWIVSVSAYYQHLGLACTAPDRSLDKVEPIGLQMGMSAIAKVAVGVVCLFGFAFAALLFFGAVNPWIDQHEIPFFGSRVCDSALLGVAGLLCVYVSIRLIQAKTWAWWSALVVSVLTLGFGVFLFVAALHPRDDFARSESGFGLGMGFILMTVGAIPGVLLSLPSVRRRFAKGEAKSSAV